MVLRTAEAVLLKVSLISLRPLEYIQRGTPICKDVWKPFLINTGRPCAYWRPYKLCFFSAAFYVHKLMFGTFYKCFMSMGFKKKRINGSESAPLLEFLLREYQNNFNSCNAVVRNNSRLARISEMPTS